MTSCSGVMDCMDKRALTKKGMQAAVRARAAAGFDLINPICVFDLAERLGISVRFTDINMEGMYQSGDAPRIFLSSQRPLARRVFTCGHEVGHHVFGHGSTIDEMQEELAALKSEHPDEFLVNAFSAAVLMPVVGLRGGLHRRGTSAATATAQTIYAVACNFGVGYATLVNHLAYGLGEIAPARSKELLKSTPKSIRRDLIGDGAATPLMIVDEHWVGRAVDVEVNTTVLLPPGVELEGEHLESAGETNAGLITRAVTPGIGRILLPNGDVHFVRVAREAYTGLARYRHMEEEDV